MRAAIRLALEAANYLDAEDKAVLDAALDLLAELLVETIIDNYGPPF